LFFKRGFPLGRTLQIAFSCRNRKLHPESIFVVGFVGIPFPG